MWNTFTQVHCMAQHSSWHLIILCSRYKNTEQAQFILLLDQDTKGKDLCDFERGFIVKVQMTGPSETKTAQLVSYSFNKKKWHLHYESSFTIFWACAWACSVILWGFASKVKIQLCPKMEASRQINTKLFWVISFNLTIRYFYSVYQGEDAQIWKCYGSYTVLVLLWLHSHQLKIRWNLW